MLALTVSVLLLAVPHRPPGAPRAQAALTPTHEVADRGRPALVQVLTPGRVRDYLQRLPPSTE